MRATTTSLTLLLAAALAAPAFAAWPNSPLTNLPLCTAAGTQRYPAIVSDGGTPSGGGSGAIVTWEDYRGGPSSDVYAQHVLASGAVDPAWPANGRALCTATNDQSRPTLVSDGAGGAIVAWADFRSGTSNDIYTQHVLASGAVDPAWPANGRALCTAANSQWYPTLVSDGAGGAIVTWYDRRSGSDDIYAQHVLASGAVDPAWPADGRALCTATSYQDYPKIVADGAGGAIVTWQDGRSGAYDVYAQHVLASGAVDPAWPIDGRALCTADGTQASPRIVSDGTGGAIVAWEDSRNPVTGFDVYAQHVLASGAADPAWPADGRALCTASSAQNLPSIVSDGADGAIVAWEDNRDGSDDVYAQHVLASGAVDPAWPANGSALCTATSNQQYTTIVSDGAGGALVSWYDYRSGASYDIYAQHVLASGAVDPTWPTNGSALCTATKDQYPPSIVTDGAGGGIVTWQDERGGSTPDIYAQRVARYGYLGTPEAEIASVHDAPNDQGGKVELSWNASYLDLAQNPNLAAYDIYRSVPPTVAATRAGGALLVLLEGALPPLGPGERVAIPASATDYVWEYLQTVDANHLASQYSVLASTAFDSLGGSNPKTAFLVLARNASGSMFWPSRPDSGYSVDNLAPAAPEPLTGHYAAGSTYLHWGPNTESDLAGYRLYRGSSAEFVPDETSLVAALADTSHVDAGGMPYFYKLTAVDMHGNESPATLLSPSGTTAVEGAQTARAYFALAGANPVRGATGLRFGLAVAGRASLALYDASGRRVRTLLGARLEAGEHTASWDGRDNSGHTAPAGLYFAKLEAPGFTRTLRLVRTE